MESGSEICYHFNPDTKNKTHFTWHAWSKAADQALADMISGMWDDCCKVLYGTMETEKYEGS